MPAFWLLFKDDIAIMPADTNPTTSTVVTDEDWMTAVTKASLMPR
jgi:hypothetical protein